MGSQLDSVSRARETMRGLSSNAQLGEARQQLHRLQAMRSMIEWAIEKTGEDFSPEQALIIISAAVCASKEMSPEERVNYTVKAMKILGRKQS
jgi:hypothetical protein